MKKLIRFIIALFTFFSSACAYETCNAFYANGVDNNNPGKCVPFPECPYLLDIIKSPTKTASEIRMLQQLTCVKDPENPFVCCAIEDLAQQEITNNNPSDYNVANRAPGVNAVGSGDSDKIHFGPVDKNEDVKTADRMQTTSPPPEHPNFRLLPPLKECSQSILGMRILGGNETSITVYPWMARIGYYSHEDGSIKYLCAGTVINKRYILTAAHCTEEVDAEDFELDHVRLAEEDKECDEIYGCQTPQDLKIEKVIPHPNYSKRDKSNDIGLIRLAEDIRFDVFTQPVCLPFVEEYGLKDYVDPSLTKYLDTGIESAKVAGWGKTRWNNLEGSLYLQHVALPVLSMKQCQKNYEHHKKVIITDMQLCAGGEKGKDSCGGDSGGGLFISEKVPIVGKIKVPKMFQFGVVSFGPTHCGIGNLPGVYSNVYKYKSWILDQLQP